MHLYMLLITYVTFLILPPQCFAGNVLRQTKLLTGWTVLDLLQMKKENRTRKNVLVPGLPELGGGGGMRKFALETGFEPHPIDKYHSGHPKRDTCQPWEDCASQRIGDLSTSEVTTTPEPTMNLSSGGNVTFFNASELPKGEDGVVNNETTLCLDEWDLTKEGCQCIDACECNRGLENAQSTPTCKTMHIRTKSFTNQTILEPCGQFDMTSDKFVDTCMPRMAPTMEPEILVIPRKKVVGNKSLYRDFNSPGNQRFLPKSSCFSRTYYCATFPMFQGCVPGVTYEYTEEIENQVKECKKIEDQKSCEAKELCGKGKHGTCHHMCVWSEDSPGWFRELRGKQNAWLKRHKKDPGTVGESRFLPVLQPAWDGSTIREMHDGADEIIKKQKRDHAGVETTSPPPSHVKAGDVGNGRSAGFVRAPQVGVNVGNDMTFSSEDDGPSSQSEKMYDLSRQGTLLSVARASGKS